MSSDNSKSSRQDRLRKIKFGVEKYFSTSTLTLAGVSYTQDELQQFLQTDIDASDAADLAKGKWHESVQHQRDTRKGTNVILRALRSFVMSQYGDAPNAAGTLAEFGYTPRKLRTPTVDTKAAAKSKREATRKKRGTMGKRQKEKVKADAPATPPASPPASPATTTTTTTTTTHGANGQPSTT